MKCENQTQYDLTENQQLNNPYIHKIKPTDVVYEESESDSIERCPHDEENPYVMISSELLRNQSLSPECRWLLCYLLSHQKGWKINRKQVANHLTGHCGRDRTDNMFNEAIDAGYMKRVDILIKREKGGALRRSKYFVSETPKFKKCFQHPPFQGPGTQPPGNTGDKVRSSKVISSISNPPPLSPQSSKKDLPKALSPTKLDSDNIYYVANSEVLDQPKQVSLCSEEEDFHTYKILEELPLSPKEKKRLTKSYAEKDVVKAVTLSKTQKVKKTIMGLLLNILDNPDKWEDASNSQLQTPQQHKALEYNKTLAESKKLAVDRLIKSGKDRIEKHKASDIAKRNEKTIPQGYMEIICDGYLETLPLKSSYFEQDIKNAIAQLR